MRSLDPQLASVALLQDPTRRALYLYVVGRDEPVGRDEAARATGATRENAAFHLDKLVDAGLLDATFRRLGGRTGPGAGRPSKLYRRGAGEIHVTLPARRYELAAEVLAEALEQVPARGSGKVAAAARRAGAALGAAARKTRAGALRAVSAMLAQQGFEPTEPSKGVVRLRNCPFHDVAARHPDVVCGMNLAFIEGVLDGADVKGVAARLDPEPGRCCVTLHATDVNTRS